MSVRKKHAIAISGALLSSLWRETSEHESDCEGLLFGTILQQNISEMTDELTVHSCNVTYGESYFVLLSHSSHPLAIQRFVTLQTPLMNYFNPASGVLGIIPHFFKFF